MTTFRRSKRGKYGRGSQYKRPPKVLPTQERVRELFDYLPETGELIRKIRVNNNRKTRIGDVVGVLETNGYLQVVVDGWAYTLHRLIWLWMEGYFPENQIDHINRIRIDNRWVNLREVSSSCNQRNCSPCKRNTSGVIGVNWHSRDEKWTAYIRSPDGVLRFLGHFSTDNFTEAVCARYAAEQCLDWHTCDANSSAYQYLKQEGILK